MQTQQPTMQAESDLVALAARGDLQAFNDLVLKYQDVAYGLALAILRDRDEAEDATQEALISAFRHIGSFRGGSFRGWLLRITTNACYDVFRSRRRYPTTPLYLEDQDGNELDCTPWLVDPRPSPDEEADDNEVSRALYRWLNELPAPYRLAITLVDVHGLDYAEAAQALGVPAGTIKSRLARARGRVREALSQEFRFAAGNRSANALAAA